jgi:hypothetical protein
MPRIGLLLAALALTGAGAARAELVTVTPDSISQPPLGSGGSYTLNDLVIDQYRGLGLAFRYSWWDGSSVNGDAGSTVIENQKGVQGWVGAHVVFREGSPVFIYNGNHLDPVVADLVVPGTQVPATTALLRVQFSPAGPGLGYVNAYDKDGNLLLSVSRALGSGLDPWFTLRAPGIHSFSAGAYWLPGPGMQFNAPPWGVAAVTFNQEAPEPSGLVLCGLGVPGLAGLARKRRQRPPDGG